MHETEAGAIDRAGQLRADDDHERITYTVGPLDGMHVYFGQLPGWIDPLDNPTWVPAAAASHMRERDFVLGYSHGDLHMALPWWVMKNHHVANLRFPDADVLIVLCEACSTAAAFDAAIEGTTLTFRVAGTYRGTHFIVDRETGSYWAPFMGVAIHGPLMGTEIRPLALYQCSWAEWKTLHPDTVVASGVGEPRDGHGAGIEPGSLEKNMAKSAIRDKRLKRNTLILGVQVGAASRAYPLTRLAELAGVINDTLGGEPILIAGQPGSVLALAYSREAGSTILTFEKDESGMRDIETGSSWGIEGHAVAGPLRGERLTFVRSVVGEWYEYAASHPEVEVFEG